MRIDVALPRGALEVDLRDRYLRMRADRAKLRPLPIFCARLPQLAFRYREADGEFFVYAEDAARERLAGYTVFSRLVELDRQADRLLRAPHSRYAPGYARQGLASAVYGWALNAGMCLLSGPRQSAGAHALWHRLGAGHALGYVRLHERELHYLGECIGAEVLQDFATRMVLLGSGWSGERFRRIASAPRRPVPA
jgi:hypothetical protein